MKNQYFGDVNDYLKYGLLRILTERGSIRATVCWMLTPDDGGGDGRKLGYLARPAKWRPHDPELYEFLRETVLTPSSPMANREVGLIETSGLMLGCRFHRPILPDEAPKRGVYMKDLAQLAEGTELLFFDPDNGLEVKSFGYGSPRSSKYLYWREAREWFASGYSLLLYQHFPHVNRTEYTARLARRLHAETASPTVWTLTTPNVLFLLASQNAHARDLAARVDRVAKRWAGRISVRLAPGCRDGSCSPPSDGTTGGRG